jgi:hypothetical protein
MLKRFLILLLFTATSGFADDPESVRASSLRTGICVIHHVPLQTAIVYDFSPSKPGTCDPSASTYRLQAKYPNCIPLCSQFERDKYFRKPMTVQYCPACQRRFDAGLKPD